MQVPSRVSRAKCQPPCAEPKTQHCVKGDLGRAEQIFSGKKLPSQKFMLRMLRITAGTDTILQALERRMHASSPPQGNSHLFRHASIHAWPSFTLSVAVDLSKSKYH